MSLEGLQLWLAERDVVGARRVVAVDDRRILVSKTPPGFVEGLFEALEALGSALADDSVAAECALTARVGRPRVDAWEEAVMRAVARQVVRLNLPPTVVEEVKFGVESVAALLRSVLWSDPKVGECYALSAAESAAYEDLCERLTGDAAKFTRVYGIFEGRPVVAHCPGASLARRLLDQGWRLCTRAEFPGQ